MARRILITGGSGQVGSALQELAWPQGWELVAPGSAELDLAQPDTLGEFVASGGFAAVINAGAYTAVDKAESDVARAWQVNAVAPAVIARACAESGARLVQVSTDYVFPGDKQGAWEPDDAISPINTYGASKAGGELAVRASGARHAIIRTAWVVSASGYNFLKTMLRVGREREQLQVVSDQHGAPTFAGDLASALMQVTRAICEDPHFKSGTWHFSNAGPTTWHEFAGAIFQSAARHGYTPPELLPITTADYPTPARRPANSLLSTASLTRDFGIDPRPWQEALDEVIDTLLGEEPR